MDNEQFEAKDESKIKAKEDCAIKTLLNTRFCFSEIPPELQQHVQQVTEQQVKSLSPNDSHCHTSGVAKIERKTGPSVQVESNHGSMADDGTTNKFDKSETHSGGTVPKQIVEDKVKVYPNLNRSNTESSSETTVLHNQRPGNIVKSPKCVSSKAAKPSQQASINLPESQTLIKGKNIELARNIPEENTKEQKQDLGRSKESRKSKELQKDVPGKTTKVTEQVSNNNTLKSKVQVPGKSTEPEKQVPSKTIHPKEQVPGNTTKSRERVPGKITEAQKQGLTKTIKPKEQVAKNTTKPQNLVSYKIPKLKEPVAEYKSESPKKVAGNTTKSKGLVPGKNIESQKQVLGKGTDHQEPAQAKNTESQRHVPSNTMRPQELDNNTQQVTKVPNKVTQSQNQVLNKNPPPEDTTDQVLCKNTTPQEQVPNNTTQQQRQVFSKTTKTQGQVPNSTKQVHNSTKQVHNSTKQVHNSTKQVHNSTKDPQEPKGPSTIATKQVKTNNTGTEGKFTLSRNQQYKMVTLDSLYPEQCIALLSTLAKQNKVFSS